MEEILTRHRKEQKDLQGRITQKKKNATKKTRKGVNDECERLERELKERQQVEISALDSSANENGISDLAMEDLTDMGNREKTIGDNDEEVTAVSAKDQHRTMDPTGVRKDEPSQPEARTKKPNRQKARLERRAAEQQAQVAAAEEEAAMLPDRREQEISTMQQEITKRRLVETQIRPDGHCMYSACALTLPDEGMKNFQAVRSATAEFITDHADDFSPFLEEPIETYVTKIRDTAEWGGHLELQAIAKAFSVNVNVLQSNGHVEQISPEQPAKQEIWLAYYRHSFGLGEHYNALRK